jgi:fimbrial chaperone protein
MRALCASLALILVTAGVSGQSPAAIHIAPTTVTVLPGETVSSFTLRNDGQASVAFALSAFAWRTSATDDMTLTPTEDIVVFPTWLQLSPGAARRVRVGTRVAAGDVELAYRLIVEEVNAAGAPPGQVSMRAKYNMPLFIQPRNRKASVKLDGLTLSGPRLSVRLANIGAVHVTPSRLVARGLDAQQRTVWQRELSAWYLLPGDARVYEANLSAAECERTVTVAAEATFLEGAGLTVRTTEAVKPGRCTAS